MMAAEMIAAAPSPKVSKKYKAEAKKPELRDDQEISRDKVTTAKLQVARNWKVVITKSSQVTDTKFILAKIKKQLSLISGCG